MPIALRAQRLVRVLCGQCKEEYEATPHELVQLGIDPERTRKRDERPLAPSYEVHGVPYEPIGWRGPGMPRIYRAVGCSACDNKGFSGRMGIYELLMADDVVGAMVLRNADAQSIKRAAQQQGMDSLRDDGARKVLEGVTTVAEVVAATQEDVELE
jgi:general secretion pathway protein E